MLGASASYVMYDVTFTLYAQNLTDEKGSGGGIPSELQHFDTGVYEGWYGNANFEYIAQPRSIGLAVNYNF